MVQSVASAASSSLLSPLLRFELTIDENRPGRLEKLKPYQVPLELSVQIIDLHGTRGTNDLLLLFRGFVDTTPTGGDYFCHQTANVNIHRRTLAGDGAFRLASGFLVQAAIMDGLCYGVWFDCNIRR